MTKKTFIALADAIREHNSYAKVRPKPFLPFNEMHISALADFCQSQNPDFKRDRWLGYIAGTNGQNGGAR